MDSRNEERLNPAVRFSLSTNSDVSQRQQGRRRPVSDCVSAAMACGSEGLKLLGWFSSRGSSGRGSFNSGRGSISSATAASRATTAAGRAAAATTTATTTMLATTAAARRRAAATATAAARTAAAARTTARRATTAAAAATAATMTESRSFVLATNQSHANQREEDRDTQQNDTIHNLILHLPSGTFRRNNSSCRQHGNTSQRDGVKSSEVQPSVPCGPAVSREWFRPVCETLSPTKTAVVTQARLLG
jgi:hypothetical protein